MLGASEICGWALAHAHARSGDPVAIAGYLGGGETFDRALASFAERSAAQNERDGPARAAAGADRGFQLAGRRCWRWR